MATSPLVTNEAIKLIIKIPVPNCAELAKENLVTCEGNLVSGVYDLVGFLNVIFQFMIIAGITVVVFMAILEGFKILFYSPVASKIKDAKSNLTKLATTLIILMFSVVILNQINPKLINGTLDITNVTKVELCGDITDKAICDENSALCTWYKTTSKCLNKNEVPCDGYTSQSSCPSQVCAWTANKCVAVSATSDVACYAAESSQMCNTFTACSMSDGCYPKNPKNIKYVNGQLPNVPEMDCYKYTTAEACPRDLCVFSLQQVYCYSDKQIAEKAMLKTQGAGALANGVACTVNTQCASALCNKIDSYNKCSVKGIVGANCLDNNYCATPNTCDTTTKKCVAPITP